MTNRERFVNVLNFRPVDRLPVMEWAGWWDKTIDRWHGEGLPAELSDAADIRDYLGLDAHRQYALRPRKPSCPEAKTHGAGVAWDPEGYHRIREHLYPEEPFDRATLERWAKLQKEGKLALWMTLEGFFWFPRTILGIEKHLYAFYDQPELIHEINKDLLAFNLRAVEQSCAICTPDFMAFAEDLSYNHGPMLSETLFEEFIAPYYRRITPMLRQRGIVVVMDSDGEVGEVVPWAERIGVDGFLPLERQAGVDIGRLRARHPHLRLIGAFDKTVMHKGEARMRAEFERLLPVMRQGGYIPSVDHQTPPEVSLRDYRLYVKLLKEYCQRAAS